MMAAKKIFLVPTDYPDALYTDFIPANASPGERTEMETGMKQFAKGNRDRLKHAVSAGVLIAAGSDEYYQMGKRTRGQSSTLIYESYRDSGMTPWQIIQAATVNGAELAGWPDQIGAIEAGKYADIVATAGDPTQDVTELEKVKFVMKSGQVVRDNLAAGKAEAR